MKLVNGFLDVSAQVFLAVANALLFVMLAINVANILSRPLTGKGLIWVFPWTETLFVWAVFFAFYAFFRRNQDVAIDLLTRRFSARAQVICELVITAIVIVFLVVLLKQALVLVPKQVGKIDMVGIQRYWLSIPFFVSCFMIALHFLTRVVTLIAALKSGAEAEVDP